MFGPTRIGLGKSWRSLVQRHSVARLIANICAADPSRSSVSVLCEWLCKVASCHCDAPCVDGGILGMFFWDKNIRIINPQSFYFACCNIPDCVLSC